MKIQTRPLARRHYTTPWGWRIAIAMTWGWFTVTGSLTGILIGALVVGYVDPQSPVWLYVHDTVHAWFG